MGEWAEFCHLPGHRNFSRTLVFANNVQTNVRHSMGVAVQRAGVSFIVILVCASGACAQTNPFEAILTKNIFGLVPIPPPPEQPKPALPKITLTGITTVTGPARALLKMAPPAGASNPGGERFFNLKAGEREGDLEVLEINEKPGSVVVNYSGTTITLVFEPEKPNSAGPAASTAPHVALAAEPVPPPLPGVSPEVASRSPEESVLLYEANRARNEQLTQAGIRRPKMPAHPWVNGQ
jgi:hypothetical protein